jgi:hypothetical protein
MSGTVYCDGRGFRCWRAGYRCCGWLLVRLYAERFGLVLGAALAAVVCWGDMAAAAGADSNRYVRYVADLRRRTLQPDARAGRWFIHPSCARSWRGCVGDCAAGGRQVISVIIANTTDQVMIATITPI